MRHTTAALLLLCWSVPLPAAAADDYQPDINRVRAALADSRPLTRTPDTTILPNAAVGPSGVSLTSARLRQRATVPTNRDTIWDGLLWGAAAGGAAGSAGGRLWASAQCGSNDIECLVIADSVALVGGAVIGAVVGGILDSLR